jgi:hypothetical protein
MYIEARRPDGRIEYGRIARVGLSKTGRTVYYDGRTFQGVGRGEYIDSESGESYWFSGASRARAIGSPGPGRTATIARATDRGAFPSRLTRTCARSTGGTYVAFRSGARSQ